MKLKNDNFSDIYLLSSESVNIVTINQILKNLLTYDKLINIIGENIPSIWECKWYNDNNISGYSLGHTVWYNTENPKAFVIANKNKIYNYAKDNSYLKNKIKPYSPNQYELYYSILTGYTYNSYGDKLPALFDLGEMSNPVQIKISRIDNNKEPLSNSNAWKDFFVYDGAQYKDQISALLSGVIRNHIENYHLYDNTLSSTLDLYLNNNFYSNYDNELSNITKLQKYYSHKNPLESNGFDYIKLFVKKPQYQTFINTVEQTRYKTEYWKVLGYDKITDVYGEILDSVKDGYFSIMSGCNNYMNSGIDVILNNLKHDMLANIEFTSINNTTSPNRTTNVQEIKGRENLYNCSFDKIPLSSETSADISEFINNYENVQSYEIVNYPNVTYTFNKWFKLWNSGKLEHGGIVATKGKTKVDVDFNWKYSLNYEDYDGISSVITKTAPTYDYPTLRFSFYGHHKTLSEANQIFHDEKDNVSTMQRYTVSLTPITSVLSSNLVGNNSIDYSKLNEFGNYVQCEISEIKNDGFSIIIDDDSVQYYSYHVIGYKTNVK